MTDRFCWMCFEESDGYNLDRNGRPYPNMYHYKERRVCHLCYRKLLNAGKIQVRMTIRKEIKVIVAEAKKKK